MTLQLLTSRPRRNGSPNSLAASSRTLGRQGRATRKALAEPLIHTRDSQPKQWRRAALLQARTLSADAKGYIISPATHCEISAWLFVVPSATTTTLAKSSTQRCPGSSISLRLSLLSLPFLTISSNSPYPTPPFPTQQLVLSYY